MTVTQRKIPSLIAARQDFQGSNMNGVHYPDGCPRIDMGWGVDSDASESDVRVPEGSRYVIWSYQTPIAWIDPDGFAVIPARTYSRTTNRHQSIVHSALRHDADAQEIATMLTELDRAAEQAVIASLTGVAA
jgi:hypothetical protein